MFPHTLIELVFILRAVSSGVTKEKKNRYFLFQRSMQDLLQNSDFAAYSSINEHKIKYDRCTPARKHIAKLQERNGSKLILKAESGGNNPLIY